ncbi:MAG: hypothetical protein WCY93_06570, partial [Anaerolineaceae bacterium]
QWRLVDMLSQTRFTEKTCQAVQATIAARGWPVAEIKVKLLTLMGALEARNRKIAAVWLEELTADC